MIFCLSQIHHKIENLVTGKIGTKLWQILDEKICHQNVKFSDEFGLLLKFVTKSHFYDEN